MLLFELFDQSDDEDDSPAPQNGMKQQIRQAALDVIIPLLGQNVPFVTMQQIIDRLSGSRFGIVITPALVMEILNPDEVKAVSKIEGDRIYLEEPTSQDREVDQDQEAKDADHVNDMAVSQINNELKKD